MGKICTILQIYVQDILFWWQFIYDMPSEFHISYMFLTCNTKYFIVNNMNCFVLWILVDIKFKILMVQKKYFKIVLNVFCKLKSSN